MNNMNNDNMNSNINSNNISCLSKCKHFLAVVSSHCSCCCFCCCCCCCCVALALLLFATKFLWLSIWLVPLLRQLTNNPKGDGRYKYCIHLSVERELPQISLNRIQFVDHRNNRNSCPKGQQPWLL